MKLHLNRPIVFFDLETTGIDVVKDHIVELCYIKIHPDGKEESNTLRIRPADAMGNTVHIPEQASSIHHIYDKDVEDCPTFKELVPRIKPIFEGCDLGGYNSNHFDIPLLVEEFLRAGVSINLRNAKFIDVCVIFKKMEQRTLSAAYKFYCKKELENAHSALADTRATLDVLEAQLDFYPDLQNDVGQLAQISTVNRNVDLAGRFVYDNNDNPVFNFGKYKGKLVTDVLRNDPGYYGWLMQGDFPLNTKQVITAIKLKSK